MADSNATYNFSVNADLPDYGAGIVSFENVQYFTSGNNEVLAGQTYELTLDANGEGTQVLPAPDNTGTLAVNWVIGLPSGESVRAALSYSAGAQELSDILANASTTTDPDTITAALANKQNRDTDAIANNLARMNASGDAEDSSIPAAWNATDMTMDITHNANVTGQVNQEFFVLARNNSGSNITNGQVVKLTGSVSSRPTIALAQADSVANARQIGVATEDIDNNATGFVTVAGLVRGLNTSAYNEGDVLYLSTSVAGAFTATKPTWPSIAIEVGIVVVKNATLGSIFVGAYETGAGAHEKAAAAQAAAEAASVAKSGDTMTGTLNLDPGSDDTANVLTIPITTTDAPDFKMNIGSTFFIDTDDITFNLGWGADAIGAGEHSWFSQWEFDYNDGSGHFAEYHINLSPLGSSSVIRPTEYKFKTDGTSGSIIHKTSSLQYLDITSANALIVCSLGTTPITSRYEINGQFWPNIPDSDPNGFYIRDQSANIYFQVSTDVDTILLRGDTFNLKNRANASKFKYQFDVFFFNNEATNTATINILEKSNARGIFMRSPSSNVKEHIILADNSGNIEFGIGIGGKILTNQDATNTNTPSGATAHQLPIYNEAGTLLGYIPVYGSAW